MKTERKNKVSINKSVTKKHVTECLQNVCFASNRLLTQTRTVTVTVTNHSKYRDRRMCKNKWTHLGRVESVTSTGFEHLCLDSASYEMCVPHT